MRSQSIWRSAEARLARCSHSHARGCGWVDSEPADPTPGLQVSQQHRTELCRAVVDPGAGAPLEVHGAQALKELPLVQNL
jgi:hypothetical protein